MKQQLKETVIYEPNEGVKITVNNKPVRDDNGRTFYEQSVNIKLALGWKTEKLSFSGEEDIRAMLDNIDLEDPQQELPL